MREHAADGGLPVTLTEPPPGVGVGAAGIAVPVVVVLVVLVLALFVVRTRRTWAREKRHGLRNRFSVGPDGDKDSLELSSFRDDASLRRPVYVRSQDQGKQRKMIVTLGGRAGFAGADERAPMLRGKAGLRSGGHCHIVNLLTVGLRLLPSPIPCNPSHTTSFLRCSRLSLSFLLLAPTLVAAHSESVIVCCQRPTLTLRLARSAISLVSPHRGQYFVGGPDQPAELPHPTRAAVPHAFWWIHWPGRRGRSSAATPWRSWSLLLAGCRRGGVTYGE